MWTYKLKIREYPSGPWDEVDPQLEIDDDGMMMQQLIAVLATLAGVLLGWFLKG